MKLDELILEACKKSPEFTDKYHWRVTVTRRKPDIKWLMGHLEDILGVEYVKEAAQKEIERQNSIKRDGEQDWDGGTFAGKPND